jgi:hypothetical protein
MMRNVTGIQGDTVSVVRKLDYLNDVITVINSSAHIVLVNCKSLNLVIMGVL